MAELVTMVEEPLDDILRTLFLNVQSGIRSVVSSGIEQVMLDLLSKDVIGETLDAHIMENAEQDAVAEVLAKRLLAPGWFMALVATLARRETDSAMKEKNFSVAYPSTEPMDTAKMVDDISESPSIRSDSGSDIIPQEQLSKPHSKCRHSRQRNIDVNKIHPRFT